MIILRYRGILPQEIAESRSLIPGLTQAEVQAADKISKSLDKKINTLVTKVNRGRESNSQLTKSSLLNYIDNVLDDCCLVAWMMN